MDTIGQRLRLTRQALGFNQAAFARKAEVSASAYNQYEKDKMRPALDQAVKLRDAHNLTLDWIFLGDDDGLQRPLADAIQALHRTREAGAKLV